LCTATPLASQFSQHGSKHSTSWLGIKQPTRCIKYPKFTLS